MLRPADGAAQETFHDAIRIADSAWSGRRFVEAKASYQRALVIDSVASSRAVYRMATLRSWDGELEGAIALFARYVRLEPRDEEGRIALARTYAWAGETSNSVAVYDAILSRDSTYRDAALGAAQALAWAGKYRESLARYDVWIGRYPNDHEASLARARSLAWAGRLGDAGRAYAQIAANGEPLEGRKGQALIAAWKGDLLASEEMWTRLTHEYPNDARVWLGLAQVLRWSGRAPEAREALAHALAVDPNDVDVRTERRWIEGALAPAVSPSITMSWDSDGNHTTRSDLRASLHPMRLVMATLDASQHQADLGSRSARSMATHLTLRWLADRRLTISGDAGVIQAAANGGALSIDRSRFVGSAQATLKLTSRITAGTFLGYDIFDETVTGVLSSLDVTSAIVSGDVELGKRVTFGMSADRARFAGGSRPNERNGYAASLRWRARRAWSFAVNGRDMGYSATTHDGYFAPERYRLGEAMTHYEPMRDFGWSGYFEGAAGMQFLRSSGADTRQATQRVGVGLVHRWSPGSEFGMEYGASNVAGSAANPGESGIVYRYQSVTLRGRLRLR